MSPPRIMDFNRTVSRPLPLILKAKPLRTPSNIFVVNLAFCDFMMLTKAPLFIHSTLFVGYLEHVHCQAFAAIGAISGIGAATTNAAIAYDRYNTIARPFDGRMTYGKAFFIVICIWCYAIPWIYLPLSETWSRYVPEGFLTTCSFDYLTPTNEIRTFTGVMFVVCYCIPMSFIIYFYSQIVSHVFRHEKALREQAKKMNVDSLRSNQDANAQSAEVRIAKAAITICFLFVAAWTPYAVVALIGAFGDRSLLTPGVTMIPATFCKTVACFDPYVYAISHPKYRMELSKRIPCLGIKETPPAAAETQSTTTTTA
ncbi:opsin, ultraviolet-sensitive-like isoform X2 [Adelges cooleyi]|uniref:opsin, ultraviolet-sensitive-like isoform X2 n=1 Tax=Adelges cooleyi TaxID=133065 RepID=UPI00217F61F2|nr:opsin, ultraviolet-sensitive-like isoform X2 [Adelges cooleyi]